MSGRFTVIYADPAWSYSNRTIRGGAERHYPTMSLDDICRLPIARLAAPDAALFTWATWPTLPDALQVIAAWVKLTKGGKPTTGTGHYTRANTEIVLLGTRGRIHRVDLGVPQVILDESFGEETVLSPRFRHSAKPPEVRDRIVRLLGDVPRLELFAREHAPGWHAWGNQLPPYQLEKP